MEVTEMRDSSGDIPPSSAPALEEAGVTPETPETLMPTLAADVGESGGGGDVTVASLPVVTVAQVASSSTKVSFGGVLDGVLVVAPAAGESGEGPMNVEQGSGVTIAVGPKKTNVRRTSCYHGVTRHRWTGKYEAHLWDNSINVESRKRKGRQVYLGGYDSEEKAARAYDLGALKFLGTHANNLKLNFPLSDYEKELEEMKNMNQDEWVASLRRKSSCFSRGTSIYRGVTRRKDGKWQSRLGSVNGTRDIYLGAFSTEEEAAIAYDIAAVELRGPTAVTNFNISNYLEGDYRPLEKSSDA